MLYNIYNVKFFIFNSNLNQKIRLSEGFFSFFSFNLLFSICLDNSIKTCQKMLKNFKFYI